MVCVKIVLKQERSRFSESLEHPRTAKNKSKFPNFKLFKLKSFHNSKNKAVQLPDIVPILQARENTVGKISQYSRKMIPKKEKENCIDARVDFKFQTLPFCTCSIVWMFWTGCFGCSRLPANLERSCFRTILAFTFLKASSVVRINRLSLFIASR